MIMRREGAEFDEHQEKVLVAIEFFTTGYTITATRGHSSPLEQLRLIERFAKQDGVLLKPFVSDDLHTEMIVDGENVYLWQPAWRALLDLYHSTGRKQGKLINPPLAAVYKGRIILPSPHIAGGKSGEFPIDFSGWVKLSDGSDMQSLDIVADICHQAQLSGVGISNITKEIGNNCVHIDLAKRAA